MDPFDIFPVKVWEEILHRVKNPLDKLHTIKTNQSFHLLELFQEYEDEWFFTAVLDVLVSHFYLTKFDLENPWDDKVGLKSTVLNCKLVSKGTKQIVDNAVERHWEKFGFPPPFVTATKIHTPEMAKACLALANRSNRSITPFICGGLLRANCHKDPSLPSQYEPSLEQIAELVSHPNIGINLRGLRIKISFKYTFLQDIYNFVQELLQYTPNITSLSIRFFPTGVRCGWVTANPLTLPNLPCLKHLDIFENIYEGEFGSSFFRNCLDFNQYFEQLIYLEMSIWLWNKEYQNLRQFSKLRSLRFVDVPIHGWNQTIMKIIEDLDAPALESLTLLVRDFYIDLLQNEYEAFFKTMSEKVPGAIYRNRMNLKHWILYEISRAVGRSRVFKYHFLFK